MRKTLRWYQREAVSAALDYLHDTKRGNPIISAVTGTGKSLMQAALCAELEPNNRVLMLAPSRELVAQNYEEFSEYNPEIGVGIYCAALGRKDLGQRVTIGTPGSVVRGLKNIGRIDYILVDECHLVDAANDATTYMRILAHYPQARVVGLTATPYRMRGKRPEMLDAAGELWGRVVYDLGSTKQFNRLLREGYLAPLVQPTDKPEPWDLSNVRVQGGDYATADLDKLAAEHAKEDVASALASLDGRQHVMWFCTSIRHAKAVHALLDAAGESSIIIHGELDSVVRAKDITAYLDKQHRHVVSVATLTTGFNAKFVDALVILRPTQSTILYVQIMGRGLRPYDGKSDCLVIDYGGNVERHGPVNALVEFQGDDRNNLWACSIEKGFRTFSAPGEGVVELLYESRLRTALAENQPEPCGYYNDAESIICANCGRLRHNRLVRRSDAGADEQQDTPEEYGEGRLLVGDDEAANVATHKIDRHTMTFDAAKQTIVLVLGNGDGFTHTLPLSFDKSALDPDLYAAFRLLWKRATRRDAPEQTWQAYMRRDEFRTPDTVHIVERPDRLRYVGRIDWLDPTNGRTESFRYTHRD